MASCVKRLLVSAVAATLVGCASTDVADFAEVAEVTVDAKPVAELMFDDAPPARLAPQLAAECTRRLMAVIRNTPEKVVCKHKERLTAEGPLLKASELWTFVLTAEGDRRTRVEGETALEAATQNGYAVVSFKDPVDDGGKAMLAFLEDVQALDGLRGAFRIRAEALVD